MSGRSERGQTTSLAAKIRPIAGSVKQAGDGLPSNLDAEQCVLGSMLLDDSRFEEVSELNPGDFELIRHQRVFGCMKILRDRGEHIDRVTVAEELASRGEQGPDCLSFLLSLDDGLPRIPHLDSYVKIITKNSTLRRMILASNVLVEECRSNGADPKTLLARHVAQMEALDREYNVHGIHRVEDLESIFAGRMPVEYLVKPELPAKALVCLTGDSESGKTTLACAWAREVLSRGNAVLILDRDKNPRERVCERLERLGIASDGEHLRIWDCEQRYEAPQPDHPVVTDWISRMGGTGKSQLVIVDSLVNFLNRAEDENSAVDMRALFNRCRTLTKLGATVILIHHTNRNGETRGSSDFKPAADQAFLVSNHDRTGGRLLDVITLKCQKSRYGLGECITYHYATGKILRVEERDLAKEAAINLVRLLSDRPGILTEQLVELGQQNGLKRAAVRDFLEKGAAEGTIRVVQKGRKRHHYYGAETV